jgi:ribosomal protein S12 methylthiotransferase
MRSRSIDSVVKEVRMLGEMGVQEVNLVAQDLTSYGLDSRQGGLTELLSALSEDSAVPWIRTLYAYPVGTDAELLRIIEESPVICNYFDIPLQHASESILRAMQRPVGRFGSRAITEFIRRTAPSVAIRTTFIVGFPGETEADVRALEELVAEGHYSSVGVFTYSPERGTPAALMDNQISDHGKEERKQRIMLAQQAAVEQRLGAMIGTTIPVLMEGVHGDTDMLLVGRAEFQAPEVDGTVLINEVISLDGEPLDSEISELPIELVQGSIQKVRISEVVGYDLVGGLVVA